MWKLDETEWKNVEAKKKQDNTNEHIKKMLGEIMKEAIYEKKIYIGIMVEPLGQKPGI